MQPIWPDGCISLAIALQLGRPPFGALVGARTTVLHAPTAVGDVRWGIRFRPEAGAVVCGRSAASLRDALIDARSIFPDSIDRLISAVETVSTPTAAADAFDRWLASVVPAHSVSSLAARAVTLIVDSDGTRPIADVAAALRVSVRQLQRTFLRATGLTPKEYAKTRRARAALKRLASDLPSHTVTGLSRVAAESGYADQAHLTRECRRLLSLSPTELTTLLDDIAHHALID